MLSISTAEMLLVLLKHVWCVFQPLLSNSLQLFGGTITFTRFLFLHESGSVKLSPLVYLTCSSIMKSISVTWRPGMARDEQRSALREIRRRLTVTARVIWFVTSQYNEQAKAPGPVCSHTVVFLFFWKGGSFKLIKLFRSYPHKRRSVTFYFWL